MLKTPRELFAPDEVYGAATQDRAIALVGATNIDMTLEHAIKTHLVQLNSTENQGLFGPDAPIGSFSARIKMGYAIGSMVENSAMTLTASDIFGTPLLMCKASGFYNSRNCCCM